MPVGLVSPAGSILTPGRGPNGPGPIDMRRLIASVGQGSSVPYGPQGYGNPGGVMGFIGPAVASLLASITWYVRESGSNLNGGTSKGAADRSGSDGATTSGSLTFTSASAAFTTADVGKGICIQNATRCYAKIVSINSATSVQLSNPPSASASTLSWSIGGAWATLEPVMNSSAFANATCGVTSGDSVYVGAGTYRALYSIGSNFGSSWKPTGSTVLSPSAYYNGLVNVIADVAGQFTGDAGMVMLTAYLTNDKTAPSATVLVNPNAKANVVMIGFVMVGGAATNQTGSIIDGNSAGSLNWAFIDMAFLHGGNANGQTLVRFATGPFGASQYLNLLLQRCYFANRSGGASGAALVLNLTTVAGADYQANVNVIDCLFLSASEQILVTAVNALAGHPGGVNIRNDTMIGAAGIGVATSVNVSTIFPVYVANSAFLLQNAGVAALSANTLGQIVEEFNLFDCLTARTNVNVGAGSISDGSYAPLWHMGQERIWGALPRIFGEPMAGSPLLAFGSDGAGPQLDLAGRPRPAGGGSPLLAVGALERGDTFVQAQSPVPPSGTNIWQTTGPGYQDLLLPISAVADGFSIVVQRDSSYSPAPGLSNPALMMLPNETIGVAGQTVVDSGGTGSWNTLSLQSFTPTGTGWVTIRLISYDGTGASVVSFANANPS